MPELGYKPFKLRIFVLKKLKPLKNCSHVPQFVHFQQDTCASSLRGNMGEISRRLAHTFQPPKKTEQKRMFQCMNKKVPDPPQLREKEAISIGHPLMIWKPEKAHVLLQNG